MLVCTKGVYIYIYIICVCVCGKAFEKECRIVHPHDEHGEDLKLLIFGRRLGSATFIVLTIVSYGGTS